MRKPYRSKIGAISPELFENAAAHMSQSELEQRAGGKEQLAALEREIFGDKEDSHASSKAPKR